MGLHFQGVAQLSVGDEITPGHRPQGSIQRVQLLRFCHRQQPSALQIGFSQQPTSVDALLGNVEMKNDFGHIHPVNSERG